MNVTDEPLLLSALALAALVGSGWLGRLAARRRRLLGEGEREDFGLVVGATLTLLGLIVGFSFSMALDRYDQRKALEEDEANAIGTAYLRAELLPEADATRLKGALRAYLKARIDFYATWEGGDLGPVDAKTTLLQGEMWNVVKAATIANQNPVTALVAAGVNDVLNAQGYAQAAWWNRIPPPAWAMMGAIALCATFLVGYSAKNTPREHGLLLVLPLVLSTAFYLIADIESPRGGSIRVVPQNLQALATSMLKATTSNPP
jgi:hypothetical protein